MTKEFNKVVLSIHAHPDDAEAWNAGALKLLKDKGLNVVTEVKKELKNNQTLTVETKGIKLLLPQ